MVYRNISSTPTGLVYLLTSRLVAFPLTVYWLLLYRCCLHYPFSVHSVSPCLVFILWYLEEMKTGSFLTIIDV